VIKLDVVIKRLNEQEYTALCERFTETGGDRLLDLLNCLREGWLNETEIPYHLGISKSAYYTLRSRLYDKVQDTLTSDSDGIKTELLKMVYRIPDLVYDTPVEIAVAILEKLEKDLIAHDLPHELRVVYNALKKLHFNTPKYFDYSQQYNKHLAYIVALDKSEDMVLNFQKTLGDYYLSRDKKLLELLHIIKMEMQNLSQLYQSHHLYVYKVIIDISFALYLPLPEAVEKDEPVEDMLSTMGKIIHQHPGDKTYQHLLLVYHFLSFEYYFSIGQTTKCVPFFNKVNDGLTSFLGNRLFTFSSKFLLSKLDFCELKLHETVIGLDSDLVRLSSPSVSDLSAYVNCTKYVVIVYFNRASYSEPITLLNKLINKVSFRNFVHSEIEIRLLLAYSYAMANKTNEALTVLRNVSRKVKEPELAKKYRNAFLFARMLSLFLLSKNRPLKKDDKLRQLKKEFSKLNKGSCKMLDHVKLNTIIIFHPKVRSRSRRSGLKA